MVDVDAADSDVNYCFSYYGNAIAKEIIDTISAASDRTKERDNGSQKRKLSSERCSTYSLPLSVISNMAFGWEIFP